MFGFFRSKRRESDISTMLDLGSVAVFRQHMDRFLAGKGKNPQTLLISSQIALLAGTEASIAALSGYEHLRTQRPLASGPAVAHLPKRVEDLPDLAHKAAAAVLAIQGVHMLFRMAYPATSPLSDPSEKERAIIGAMRMMVGVHSPSETYEQAGEMVAIGLFFGMLRADRMDLVAQIDQALTSHFDQQSDESFFPIVDLWLHLVSIFEGSASTESR